MKDERQLKFKDLRPDSAAITEKIKSSRHPVSLLLDRVNDPRNIGGIFRLADAALIEHVYFYGKEEEQFLTKSKRISRATIDLVPHSFLHTTDDIEQLKTEHDLIALEYTNHSIPYTDFVPKKKTLLVIGNEQRGVSDELLAISQASIHIPMYGLKTSMNVMCATSIAVYGLLQKKLP